MTISTPSGATDGPGIDELLEVIQDVSDRIVRPRFRSLTDEQVMEKNPGDLVTVADREAEVELTRWLQDRVPRVLVVGEEATAADPTLPSRIAGTDHAYTVDPVDGTKNFVQGSPDYAVMVAELRDGHVVRSWIWQPEHGRAYVAERGAGARCRQVGHPERVLHTQTELPPTEELRIATSAWGRRGEQVGDLPPLVGTWVSCGIDYPHLVEGDADALLYRSAKVWDHAPGSLLVTEAGGRVLTLDGTTYDPTTTPDGLFAAANPAVAQRVQPHVAGVFRRR